MPRWIRSFLFLLFGLLIGSSLGYGALLLLPKLPTTALTPLTQDLGLRQPWVIGFQPYWTMSKTPTDTLKHMNSLVYFAVEVGEDGTITRRTNPGETEPGWLKLNDDTWEDFLAGTTPGKLRERSLAVHASRENDIATLMSDPAAHAHTLAAELIPLMAEHHFTDLNLDVESFLEATPAAQLAFVTFAQTLKNDLNQGRAAQKAAPITLTIDIAPIAFFRSLLIDPQRIAPIADRIILMAYDFHYSGSSGSGPVAPLGGAPDTYEFDIPMAVRQALQIIPRQKLILGIPLYGYEWETLSSRPEAATVPGTGKTMSMTKMAETLRACSADCQTGYLDTAQQPYLLLPSEEDPRITRQVFYENGQSLTAKFALAHRERLGGVAFWALGYENAELFPPLKAYVASPQW